MPDELKLQPCAPLLHCNPSFFFDEICFYVELRERVTDRLSFDYTIDGGSKTNTMFVNCYPEVTKKAVKERTFYELQKPDKINKKKLRKRLSKYFGRDLRQHADFKSWLKKALSKWQEAKKKVLQVNQF